VERRNLQNDPRVKRQKGGGDTKKIPGSRFFLLMKRFKGPYHQRNRGKITKQGKM